MDIECSVKRGGLRPPLIGPSLIAMEPPCPSCSHPRPCSCTPVLDAVGVVADVAGSVPVDLVGEVGTAGGLELVGELASEGVLETVGSVVGAIGGAVVDVVTGVFDGL